MGMFAWLKCVKSETHTTFSGLNALKKMKKCAQLGAWVPLSKYFINVNQLSTIPYLSSFQNGFSEHVTIISFHFMKENVRVVRCSPSIEPRRMRHVIC